MDSAQESNLPLVSRFLSQIEKLSEIEPPLIVRCAIFPAVQLNSEWEIRSERGEPHPHITIPLPSSSLKDLWKTMMHYVYETETLVNRSDARN